MVTTMWARIENGTVAEITDLDPVGRFHPSLEWVECGAGVRAGWKYSDGEFSEPEAPEAHIPQSVSMRQARLAMLSAGILDAVESMIAAMEGDAGKAARIDWEFAKDVRRDWPLVAELGAQLGMTEDQIDELFIAAAEIPQ